MFEQNINKKRRFLYEYWKSFKIQNTYAKSKKYMHNCILYMLYILHMLCVVCRWISPYLMVTLNHMSMTLVVIDWQNWLGLPSLSLPATAKIVIHANRRFCYAHNVVMVTVINYMLSALCSFVSSIFTLPYSI